jgi:hypothetical protein
VWVHYIGSAQRGSARQTSGLQDDAFIASCRAATHPLSNLSGWSFANRGGCVKSLLFSVCRPIFLVRDDMQVELLMHIGPEHASLIAWGCTSLLIPNIASIFIYTLNPYLDIHL